MSDEHNPKIMGASGHPVVKTPHLDALAARGTMFTSAYTTSPVCVPARAAFAVGKYVHQIGYWDNADAYEGAIPSWHHRLHDAGHYTASIGKLHFRGLDGDDYGFNEVQIAMQIIEGKGDLMGLVRNDLPERALSWKIAKLAGPGETSYTSYDRDICTRAQIWLREEAPKHTDKPWVLFVSLVCPHFPLVAPAEFYYRYAPECVQLPKQYAPHERPQHPYLRDYAESFCYDILAPAGTPAAVIAKINADLQRVLALPDVKERLASQGGDAHHSSAEAFGTFMKAEHAKYAKIIAEAKIRVD